MAILKGDQFGNWTVKEDKTRDSRLVLCRCVCGVERAVDVSNLRTRSRSCGCTPPRVRTHGRGYEDYRYRAWRRIKQKCLSADFPDYKYYGGRGISMAPEWVENFSAFATYLDDALGARPEGETLDRIDNEGNYVPGNLRWATRSQQALNRRNRWRDRE